jgi:hypothetical protein
MKCQRNIATFQVFLGVQEHRVRYHPPSGSLADMDVPNLISLTCDVFDPNPLEVPNRRGT